PAVTLLAILTVTLAVGRADESFRLALPRGLAEVPVPKDNPLTAAKIELGKQLYFDPRLSRDNTISCASCHDPDKGWSNGDRFATGVRGQKGDRSAPTIINAAYQENQFWDGRAKHLEGQALGPIQNPIEMDLTIDEVVVKLSAIEGYKKQFREVFGADVTADGIAKAIASFERTVLSGDAPYDRFKAGDINALSASAQRGLKVFSNKAQCTSCHTGPNFTDGAYHNLGVGIDDPKPDPGRQVHSKLLGDRGAFKTPTLREVAKTAPYMHDGRLKTLEEVLEYYNKGGVANPQLDEVIVPLKLSDEEKADLIAFLKEGLASPSYPSVKPPQLPK
ncbi:MAG: cytochrome c peroxidase, partial [Pirellulales bacterium]